MKVKSISDWDGRTDIKLIELYHQFGVGSSGRTGSIIRWVCGISSQEMLNVIENPELYQLFMALPKECKNVLITA